MSSVTQAMPERYSASGLDSSQTLKAIRNTMRIYEMHGWMYNTIAVSLDVMDRLAELGVIMEYEGKGGRSNMMLRRKIEVSSDLPISSYTLTKTDCEAAWRIGYEEAHW